MKLGLTNVRLDSPVEQLLPIQRTDFTLVVVMRNVSDPDEFDQLCPFPRSSVVERVGEAPKVIPPSGTALADYNQRYVAFMVVKSIASILCAQGESIEQISFEWELVKLDDISTYPKYTEDLKSAGFRDSEIAKIVDIAMSLNILTDAQLKVARDDFLALKRQIEFKALSQKAELDSMGSGEPASDSESGRQE